MQQKNLKSIHISKRINMEIIARSTFPGTQRLLCAFFTTCTDSTRFHNID